MVFLSVVQTKLLSFIDKTFSDTLHISIIAITQIDGLNVILFILI